MDLLKYTDKCDFLCWTHNHMDHSKGIAKVMSLCDADSIIYITPAVYPKLISNRKAVGKDIKAVKEIICSWISKKKIERPKMFEASDTKLLYKGMYRSNDKRYKIEISSFCPHGY